MLSLFPELLLLEPSFVEIFQMLSSSREAMETMTTWTSIVMVPMIKPVIAPMILLDSVRLRSRTLCSHTAFQI